MGEKFLISFMINLLLAVEIVLPVLLLLFMGFFLFRLIRKKWVNRIFISFIYKKNVYVREFYEQVGHSIEEKGNKAVKPLAYVALILCIGLIFKILWPYVFSQIETADSMIGGGLTSTFLYMGLIFIGLGVSVSLISSFFFIKETRKLKVYSRSIEIYLLSKYIENILYMILGITLIVGTVYLWFFCQELLVPVFNFLENQVAWFGEPKINFESMLRIWRNLLISFRDQFQAWCLTSFLISLASLAVPYLWFKGRRFTRIFLALFLAGTIFSTFVSFLISNFFFSELKSITFAVWTFSSLITYMVFHLVDTIWVNRISICGNCQTENSIHSRYCRECGRKLAPSP
jgi:hypothetical protein